MYILCTAVYTLLRPELNSLQQTCGPLTLKYLLFGPLQKKHYQNLTWKYGQYSKYTSFPPKELQICKMTQLTNVKIPWIYD
jgi:hypothetical protein